MQIKGIINSIIYTNAENGYTVVSIIVDDKPETAVGIFPPITEGEEVIITGSRVVNERFGEQIQAERVITKPPAAPEGIIKYLSSSLFKGIGEVTARRIVDKFGEKTFEIIENNPIELKKVKGITAAAAMNIGEKYLELRNMQQTIIFLQQYDISLNLAIKVYKRYREGTQAVLKSNPYKLIYDIDGIGYFTADRIALKTGISRNSPLRVQAAINYILNNEATVRGNTYLLRDRLLEEVLRLIPDEITTELITKQLEELKDINNLILFEYCSEPCVMLYKYYCLEMDIAVRLRRMTEEFSEDRVYVLSEIESYQQNYGIELNIAQIEAIDAAMNNPITVITGGPGTGKTTIIKCIISLFNMRNMEVALCAPTGRAAKRLSEATGEQAMTVHRMLDLDFTGGKGYFTYSEDTRLSANVIIIDEVSMADEYVFSALINAIEKGGRLILVGDKDQLPSVGAGNVLADILSSGLFRVTELKEIYRQDSSSYIITNAHRINMGKMPVMDIKNTDFFFIEEEDPKSIIDTITSLCSVRLPQYLCVTPDRIQVLTPMKKGLAGMMNINRQLQKALNKHTGAELNVGENTYWVGDKVIQLINNYQICWLRESGESGEGVFNGDIGIIDAIDKIESRVTVRFDDDKLVTYGPGELDQLSLAYAITIHKSQGSEFDAVVISLPLGANTILTRNLLYTAVTRAKKLVVIVGDKKTVGYMVNNNQTIKRYTLLSSFLKQEISI